MSYQIQWLLRGQPVKEQNVHIEYSAKIDGKPDKAVPYLIRSLLDEIEVLEYEVTTLQANALKRMDDLQEKVENYEKLASRMAKEIRRLKGKTDDSTRTS